MRKSCILFLALMLSLTLILPAFAADPVPVEKIAFDLTEDVAVAVGKTLSIKTTIEPKNATAKKLEWSSSNEAVATVKDGKVKGIAPGEVVITAKATDESGITAQATVAVIQLIKKITSEDAKLILAPGAVWKPRVTIEPADASIQNLEWTSSNTEIATVNESSGEITAVAAGKCNIVGSAVDTSKQKVTIALQVMEHDIVITEPGEITVDFYTINANVPSETDGNGRDVTTVTYKNGLLREGSGDHTLLPVHAGSETVDVVTKLNDKKVLSSSTHTVFVAQSAVVPETDEEIGRMPAESFEGHTYQLFYSMRSWEDAEAFCEAHGGHLVTINTAAEQRFLEKYLDAVEVRASYWIGLNSGKATKFTSWITGEPLDFTKWAPGNPDRKKPESCGRIAAKSYQDHIGWTMGRGNWDDESKNYSHIAGFICEWEEENSAKALPAK